MFSLSTEGDITDRGLLRTAWITSVMSWWQYGGDVCVLWHTEHTHRKTHAHKLASTSYYQQESPWVTPQRTSDYKVVFFSEIMCERNIVNEILHSLWKGKWTQHFLLSKTLIKSEEEGAECENLSTKYGDIKPSEKHCCCFALSLTGNLHFLFLLRYKEDAAHCLKLISCETLITARDK